jgi:hypothetical protein
MLLKMPTRSSPSPMLPPLLHPGFNHPNLKQTANQALGPRHKIRVLNQQQSITKEGRWRQEVKSGLFSVSIASSKFDNELYH